MTTATIVQMPLTIHEKLDQLNLGESILISSSNRQSWANKVSDFHSKVKNKRLTIRTDPSNGEIRVWRLR